MEDGTDGVYFVYDGECPLCKMGATSFRIRQSVGVLHLINKREVENSHPLIQEINAQQLDLDKGMIIKFGSRLYQGADALHLMAMIGSPYGKLNAVCATLFRSRRIAGICCPFLRVARNMLLRLKGVGKIRNLDV